MRPLSLTPLFAHVTSLPGIGPRLGQARGETGRSPGGRPALAPALRRDRPPQCARGRRGARRRDRHDHRHRRRAPCAAQSAPALSRLVQRRDRQALPHLFQRPRGLPQEAAAGGRGPGGERQGRPLPGRGADDAPRPCRAARPTRLDPAGRAGLWPDHRPHPAADAEGDRGRRRARAGAAGMAGRGLSRAQSLGRLEVGAHPGPRAGRRERPRRRCIRHGRGSPSTSFWPASSPSPWCGITIAASPDVPPRATAACARRRWRRCRSSSPPARRSPSTRSQPTSARPSAWYGCCRAMSAAARPWWPCSPC